jgi:hypothetical protein
VTDGRNHLAGLIDFMYEGGGSRMAADMVWCKTTWCHYAIVVFGLQIAITLFGDGRIAHLAWVAFASLSADKINFGPGFFQAVVGVPDFHLLVELIDEDGNAFSLKWHVP